MKKKLQKKYRNDEVHHQLLEQPNNSETQQSAKYTGVRKLGENAGLTFFTKRTISTDSEDCCSSKLVRGKVMVMCTVFYINPGEHMVNSSDTRNKHTQCCSSKKCVSEKRNGVLQVIIPSHILNFNFPRK